MSVRVGTPPQWVDLFVSTASQETTVIGPGGCASGGSFPPAALFFSQYISAIWEGSCHGIHSIDNQSRPTIMVYASISRAYDAKEIKLLINMIL